MTVHEGSAALVQAPAPAPRSPAGQAYKTPRGLKYVLSRNDRLRASPPKVRRPPLRAVAFSRSGDAIPVHVKSAGRNDGAALVSAMRGFAGPAGAVHGGDRVNVMFTIAPTFRRYDVSVLVRPPPNSSIPLLHTLATSQLSNPPS